MAIGDAASAAGYLTVPSDGMDGKVRFGAREINRTRDYIADLEASAPLSMGGARSMARIFIGSDFPVGGLDGDIYLMLIND